MPSTGDSSRRVVTVLGVAVAALAWLNWQLVQSPVDITPISPEAGKVEGPRTHGSALLTPLDKKPMFAFRETVSRPVFVPDRKPVQRDQAPAKEAAGPGAMRLVGVMKAGDQPGRALIRMASEPTGKWIAEGEQFDGWKLREVLVRSVIVESGGRSHELTLQSVRQPADEPRDPETRPQPR
jgi:hypothetical protein